MLSGTILCRKKEEGIPSMNRDLDIIKNVGYLGKIGEFVWLKSCVL